MIYKIIILLIEYIYNSDSTMSVKLLHEGETVPEKLYKAKQNIFDLILQKNKQ